MASQKRPRDLEEDSDEEMSSGGSSPTLSSTAPTEDAEQPLKRLHLDASSASASPSEQAIRCSLPPHAELVFTTYEAYEIHYEQFHLHRCSECHKNFPSDHYLQLHITENHDPITAVKRERGERIFGCFVEDCDRKCSTPQKRRMHMIDKHNFPRLYDFFMVNDGIDRRTSMLRGPGSRKSKAYARKLANRGEGGEQRMDEAGEDVAALAKSMSALKFVPRNLKFGRGGSKTFTR